ncbi:MAG: outer membrane beta-barrel domain-containing protein [Myxococcales bacterium]|nr:outer membrane beta-barrel domain-containing protein [Myxococcales bacterium]
MRRFNTLLSPTFFSSIFAAALITLWAPPVQTAHAQPGEEPEMTFDEDEADEDSEMTFDEEPEEGNEDLGDEDLGDEDPEPDPDEPEPELDPDGDSNAGGSAMADDVEKVAWQDIVVVVRKPFLKINRMELVPSWGVTMNDNIVRHFAFSAAFNYYLTDVLAVGLEGQYFVKSLREPFDLVARQARRLPTVNKYNFGAAINFHYIPIYGKFAVLDEHIISWETALTAGVGFTQSEVIPRDPVMQPFKNTLITPNVGASMRFFLNRFITVNLGIRDYVFVDKFEAASRTEPDGNLAMENADAALINNIMFQAGLSVWFPMSFEYTTFR